MPLNSSLCKRSQGNHVSRYAFVSASYSSLGGDVPGRINAALPGVSHLVSNTFGSILDRHGMGDEPWRVEEVALGVVESGEIDRAEVLHLCFSSAILENTEVIEHLFIEKIARDHDVNG